MIKVRNNRQEHKKIILYITHLIKAKNKMEEIRKRKSKEVAETNG